MNAFDNTLDQVSEADVKSNGRLSVDGLNDCIDNMVQDIVEQAIEQSEAYTADRSELKEQRRTMMKGNREPFFSSTGWEWVDGGKSWTSIGCCHSPCHSSGALPTFFCGEAVSFTMAETSILDKLFEVISADGR